MVALVIGFSFLLHKFKLFLFLWKNVLRFWLVLCWNYGLLLLGRPFFTMLFLPDYNKGVIFVFVSFLDVYFFLQCFKTMQWFHFLTRWLSSRSQWQQMLERMWGKRYIYLLLFGMQTGSYYGNQCGDFSET